MPRWPNIRQHPTSQSAASPDMAIDSAKAAQGMNDDEKENNNDAHTNGVGEVRGGEVYDKVITIAPIDDSTSSGSPRASNGLYQKLSDLDDMEMGLNLASKDGGGRSGRRKQSKPARVFLTMDSMDTDQSEAAAKSAAATEPQGVPAAPSSQSSGAEVDKADMDMEVDEVITCDLCNDTFSTQSALTEHIQSAHSLAQDEPTPVDLYPTKYHRLGSELQQEAVFPSPNAVKIDSQQQPNETNGSPSRMTSNGSPSSQNGSTSSKSRIFHQDAYCKMCDREFCNKYFLKIHMANKHGIYEEGLGVATNGNPPPPLPPSEHHSTAPKSAPQPILSQEPTIASQPPSLPMPVMSMPTTPIPAPKAPIQNNKPLSSSGGSSNSSHKPSGTKTSPDMEDYCEICQKHFCNKYYLRKHKHDVHGIVPEAGLSSGGKRGRGSSNANNSSSTVNSLGLPSSVSSTGPSPLLLPQTPNSVISTSAAISAASSLPGLNSMANVMFINPFAPPVAILQAQPVLQSGNPAFPPPPPPMPSLPSLPSLPPVPPPASNPPGDSPKTSSASTSSTSPSTRPEGAVQGDRKNPPAGQDTLRGMGVLNADAYCEICRKEFCNKYFLNIHKANKHGIFIDDGTGPLLLPGLTPGLPENLSLRGVTGPELGETTPLKGPLPDKMKVEMKSESPMGMEEVCEICKKEFNNKFSLKIHLVNAHNIKPQDFDLGLELFKSEKMNGGQNLQGTMFSNMIAAKLADRVTCDICNKEVCNKYFLKTHKMKVHGVDPAELERFEREAEAKSTPTKAATPATGNATSPAEAAKEVLQRPNDEELLKMGIDPEAYCEICRKEFCSKYFLKTHKANIHGIKSDSATGLPVSMPGMPPCITSMSGLTSMSGITSMSGLTSMSMSSLSSMAMPKFMEQGLMRPQLPFGLPQPPAGTMVPLPGGGALPMLPGAGQLPDCHRGSSPDSDSSKSGGSKWMWKEPINQTRVMCDICNKELCNKYFLKTHLLKKHGIYYDVATGQTSGPSTPMKNKDGDSSNDTPVSSAAPTPQPTPTPPAHDTASKEGPKGDTAPEDIADGSNTVVSAKTWSIPQDQRMAADKSGLHASHELQERAAAAANNELIKTTDGEFAIQKCEICGMIFGEKVTLQFHMIRDHQGQVMVRPATNDGAAEKVEDETESRTATAAKFCLTLKRKYKRQNRSSLIKRLGASARAGIGEKVKSAIVIHIKNHMGKKKFRCAHCQERFVSRGQCQAHIRSEHTHIKAIAAGESPESKLSCKRSKTITYSLQQQEQEQEQGKPQQQESTEQHPMQAFNLEEQGAEGPHFPTDTVVYLPVLQQISQPLTATFTLTPAQQR